MIVPLSIRQWFGLHRNCSIFQTVLKLQKYTNLVWEVTNLTMFHKGTLFYLTTVASHCPSAQLTYQTCNEQRGVKIRRVCEPKESTYSMFFKYGK